MKVLKDLSREFDMDPHKVRAILREGLGQPKGKRWKWEDDDPQLKKVRSLLKNGNASSGSQSS